MKLVKTEFPGLLVLEPRVFEDNRGFFLESYNRNVFEDNDIQVDFLQDNHAYSKQKGVLRGFHFQAPPYGQSKLVWVTRGAVYDVVVDLRLGSPTYGKWSGYELSAKNFKRLFIPAGFAHAYMALSVHTEFMYKVDAPYAPSHEGGIRWDDPDLAVKWPLADPILSDKDKKLPLLSEMKSPFRYSTDEERNL
ncbi:MAG: dTDP-4-dehydrorhamnose 3,5-epimerase [Desulfovibrionaceae bacterium]